MNRPSYELTIWGPCMRKEGIFTSITDVASLIRETAESTLSNPSTTELNFLLDRWISGHRIEGELYRAKNDGNNRISIERYGRTTGISTGMKRRLQRYLTSS